MLTIVGHRILETLYESSSSLICRGIRERDNRAVILKILKQNYPTLKEISSYKKEYEIARSLNLKSVVRAYSLETYQRTLFIVFEDFNATSLKVLIEQGKLRSPTDISSLKKFLNLAIKISESLGDIHAANVIHKDINPSNIALNPKTGQVKLIDFGNATRLTHENPTPKDSNFLDGTLPYISPEQTGRMNRNLDYRTDFYSLGVSFYELLTGQPPFKTEDAMELLHCHVAKQPLPPHQVNPEIPQAISDIVMKLMAKIAEERYQSAWGVQSDLVICLMQLEASGEIENVTPGENDITNKFQISQKLYGRDTEVELLIEAFDCIKSKIAKQQENTIEFQRHANGQDGSKIDQSNVPTSDPSRLPLLTSPDNKKVILVLGDAGIGKSALVQEVYQPITAKHGYFISGKFDPLQNNNPYSAIVDSFSDLIGQLLIESEKDLKQWKEKLLSELSPNGQIIIDIIPELELILGPQPSVKELAAVESQHRFNCVFRNFVRACCSPEHPLVIFLDNLQWIDPATLKLIELIVTDKTTQNLLLIGAYRNNNVGLDHPLSHSLKTLSEADVALNPITLSILSLEHVNQLISDTLNTELAVVKPLSELVLKKTGGNPFFVKEFLKNLYSEKLIYFDIDHLGWQWDLAKIQTMDITDNLVDLMLSKLEKLSSITQHFLQIAACLGMQFELGTLAAICENSPEAISEALVEATHTKLIFPTSKPEVEASSQSYQFSHTRIKQATYLSLDEEKKKIFHLTIGRLLLQKTYPENRVAEQLFTIVNHLNLGIGSSLSSEEVHKIADLNLKAGCQAKAANAYGAAVKYLSTGIGLLSSDSWLHHYDLALSLHIEMIEAVYLNGSFDQMEKLANVVLQNAKSLLEKVKVFEVKILAYKAQNKQLKAVAIAQNFLKRLGIRFPEKPAIADFQIGIEKLSKTVSGKPIASLADLPIMTAPEQKAAMVILSRVASAAYISTPKLYPLIVFEQIHLSVKYGNTELSAFAYALYGLILCGAVGEIQTGYQFGQLALNVLKKFNTQAAKARTLFIINTYVRHWQDPVRKTLQPLLEAYKTGFETGDLEYVAWSAFSYSYHSYWVGNELSGLAEEMAIYSDTIHNLKQKTAFHWHQIYQQTILNLMGHSDDPCCLHGKAYNKKVMLPLHQEANDRTAIFHLFFNELTLCYLFGQYAKAITVSTITESYLDSVNGMLVVPLFHFYDSLARLAIYTDSSPSKRKKILAKVADNQRKLQKWSNHATTNYLHKYYLVEAERCRVLGQETKAMDLYDRAISFAKEHGYVNEAALASELAAKFWLMKGKERFAHSYMNDARYFYQRWGACKKLENLEKLYPELRSNIATPVHQESNISKYDGAANNYSSELLDLTSIMKASQAISGEIVLEKLLEKLMKILIETAGAQIGYLIWDIEGELLIEAAGQAETDCVEVLQGLPIDKNLPISIINYVVHTHKIVVKHNASHQGKFVNDPYIKKHQTKSILCAPLVNQGKLCSIVYLENNLIADAFTSDRLEVLQLLSGQAAIAIENARLYANLEIKVAERTQELSDTLEHLKATQEGLIQSEKMAALGQLIAGVAHEINTPLGAISSSARNITFFWEQHLEEFVSLFPEFSDENKQHFFTLLQMSNQKNVTLSTREQRRIRRDVAHQLEAYSIERSPTLARLLLGIGIYENLEPIIPILRDRESEKILKIVYQFANAQNSTRNIILASEKAAKVVFALKNYGHYDSTDSKIRAQISEGIETVLTLYQNHLKRGIEIIRNYNENLPKILCYPDELNQVWTNLIHNALQAMEGHGILSISVSQEENEIIVKVTDSGCGIPESIRSKIFDPFFTTKPAGEGSGLGLDIVKKIIDKHQGSIQVESQPGQTTFSVKLPIL